MDGDGAIVGRDGGITLAVTLGVCAVTLGLAPLAALAVVAWRGLHAPVAAAGARILVLGVRLPATGRPDAAFRARLTRAAALWEAAPATPIVILGGARPPAPISEAEAGRALLIAAGVPDTVIGLETRSRHTLENLRCYRADLAADGAADGPAVLVTSRTHLARSLAMAEGLGLRALPCAAENSRLAALHPWTWSREALLLLWYAVGSRFATWTANQGMLARIR